MSFFGAFSNAVMGMRAQSEAMSNIGTNIANVNTGGYKRVDTHFASLLGKTSFEQSDTGGPDVLLSKRFDTQGNIVTTDSPLDVAISGQGFFTVTDGLNDGQEYYTRDGAFQMSVVGNETITDIDGASREIAVGYLADKNGYFVKGWEADSNGVVSTTGAPDVMRIDRYAYIDSPAQTTEAQLRMNLPSTAQINDTFKYQANLYDTAGADQSLDMEWKKTNSNTWDMVYTHDSTPVPQIDTVTLAGTVEAGDTYTVNVNGALITYTLDGTEADLDAVADGLVAAINASPAVNTVVTAAATGNVGELTLTGDTPGSSYTSQVDAANGSTAVAQVDSIVIAGTPEAGDQYQIDVNGNIYTYNVTGAEADAEEIRDNIVTALQGLPAFTSLVNIATTATPGELTFTAVTAGTAFTTAATTPILGGNTDNVATLSNTTLNVPSLADNTATLANTQVAAATQVVSSATQFTFDGTGRIETPTSFSFTGTWENGATTSTTFDFSGISQFASGDLFVYNYDNNGHAKGSMNSIDFDPDGNVVGYFSNGRTRNLYQLALSNFNNPNGLEQVNGNVFSESSDSGTVSYTAAGTLGVGIRSYSHELSNVDLAEEFSKIIMTQNAYNSSATVFKTVDEMTMAARDLKG